MGHPFRAGAHDSLAAAGVGIFPPLAGVPVEDAAISLIADDHTDCGAHPTFRATERAVPTGAGRRNAARVQVCSDRARRDSFGEFAEDLQHHERFAAIDLAVAVAVGAATCGATRLRSAL